MENCSKLLEDARKRAEKNLGHSFIHDEEIAAQGKHVQNYIFITTEAVADEVRDHGRSKYDETGGVEIAILDCIGFLRHFLHLFHRLRKDFLDQYQVLVLKEPDSAVSQALKEAFLALRQAAESAD
ncbi:MAG: hypothetical protein KGJ88_11645 [Verrucomicrobiota bacterium]|nr:hypothetical protein [Verrucomicrobiota bacterium]